MKIVTLVTAFVVSLATQAAFAAPTCWDACSRNGNDSLVCLNQCGVATSYDSMLCSSRCLGEGESVGVCQNRCALPNENRYSAPFSLQINTQDCQDLCQAEGRPAPLCTQICQ